MHRAPAAGGFLWALRVVAALPLPAVESAPLNWGGRTEHHKQAARNPARAIGRLARSLAALATAVLAFTVAPEALAAPTPHHHGQPTRWPVLPPGWWKHPSPSDSARPTIKYPPGWTPWPGHVHAVVTSAMPGWRITLIAITAVVLAAAVNASRPGWGTRRKTDSGPNRPGMDAKSLRDLLDGALAGQPPIGPVAQNALTAGIRLRRRRIWPQLP